MSKKEKRQNSKVDQHDPTKKAFARCPGSSLRLGQLKRNGLVKKKLKESKLQNHEFFTI